jgi:microcin C transport system substrate-binding protein
LAITRRHLLQSGAMAAIAPTLGTALSVPLAGPARAEAATGDLIWRHGLSMFGNLRYPADFKRYGYVNPDAPRGGMIRQSAAGTFDNFNIVIDGLKGSLAGGVNLIYETLMVDANDEVASMYCALAESVTHPEDRSFVKFRLRKDARWHDGTPVTADDVVYSFDVFKQHSAMQRAYYRHVAKAEKTGDNEITFTFDTPGNRELPSIVGQLMVLPRHWWEGTDPQGRKRDITATTLEIPLGSGPYRVKEFSAGRSLTLERVRDYWGDKIPVNVGQNNFDQIRYDYFRDDTISLEAFKADQLDWISERSANAWATRYDFPAVRENRVIKEKFPIANIGQMQGYVFNLRRPLFADVRLRRAFNYAYDFEEMNRQLSFGEYQRNKSYFDGTELASSGLPEGQELQILETVRDEVPPEVFTKPYENPVGGNPEAVRSNLREATRLLKQAGFEIGDGKLLTPDGKPVSVEFLSQDPAEERGILFYKPNLEKLGLTVNVRTVDDVQYQNRLRNFDFDIVTYLWPQSLSPGNEQRDYFGSQAADRPGAQNIGGIKNPAIDALIERIIFARDRDELVASCKAMDRVLLWNFYLVPQFVINYQRSARWDRFSHFEPLPKYGISGFPNLWWWDAGKAAKTGGRS